MKTKTVVSFIALLGLLSGTLAAEPLGKAFTYQGQLTDGGQPAQGIYDLRFTIYDAAADGDAVGGPLTNSAVAVSNGLFTTMLDFGAGVFDGSSRWLEIAVRPNGALAADSAALPNQRRAPPVHRASARGQQVLSPSQTMRSNFKKQLSTHGT